MVELGIDFIPFVNVKFKDTGSERGDSCVKHALDKIDEANRQATRLSQMLFRYNKPLWAVSANAVDKEGRPIPPPKFKNSEDLEVKDNSIISLPGMSTLTSLIPDVRYAEALSVLNAMMDEIKEDLPELNYYSLKDANLSGKAIRLLLAGAIDRANEAQNNLMRGLVKLDEMALSLGKFWGLFKVGSYENGDFEHSLTCDEFFPTTNDEKALVLKTLKDSGLGLKSAMKLAGFSAEEIEEALIDAQEEQTRNENALANSLMKFNQA